MTDKQSYMAMEKRIQELEQAGLDRSQTERRIKKLNQLIESLILTDSLDRKLERITQGIVKIFDADFARIWLIDGGDRCHSGCIHANVKDGPHVCRDRHRCLHLMASSGRYTHLDGAHARVPFGCYKIGRVASAEEVGFLTNDAAHDSRVHDHDWVREFGLRAFAGFRLISSDSKPIGVLALFSQKLISPEERALLQTLANTTSEVIQTSKYLNSLKESEQKYRNLFQNAQDAIFLENTNDNIIDVNPKACELLGYTRDELLSMKVRDLQAPEVRTREDKAILNEVKEHKGNFFETVDLHKDGTRIPVEISTVPFGENGLVLCNVRDIRDRKENLAATQKSKDRYQNLFNDAPIMYVIIREQNGEPVIREINNTFLETLGYAREEVIGKSLARFYTPESVFELFEGGGFKRSLQGEFNKAERSLITREGKVIQTLVQSVSEKDPDENHTQIRATFLDITEHKAIEKQLQHAQKMESIGHLTGGIAHNFNNILSSIIGFTELALDEIEAGSTIDDNLQEVYTASKRAKHLIQQMLVFSHHHEENIQPIPVKTILADTMELIQVALPSTVRIELELNSESKVLGDAHQIQQVFMNLFTNATQAMEAVNGTLDVRLIDIEFGPDDLRASNGLKPGAYIKATVSDTGHGIRPEIIDSIYDPYFTTKAVGEGTGMGLAVVYGIVEKYGGKIEVISQINQGTKFNIYFPVYHP